MRGAVLHARGDVRIEQLPDPETVEPTDAIMRLSATCVCGSDLRPYRGITPDRPDAQLPPSLLTVSDVLGAGWFAAPPSPSPSVCSACHRPGSSAPSGSWR